MGENNPTDKEREYDEWRKDWDHHWNQVSYLGGGGGIDESTQSLINREPQPPDGSLPMREDKNSPYYEGKFCFIATTVYGDVDAPEVQVLRKFRDSVLTETGLGRKVVDLYYSGVGERVANFIENQIPSAIPAIRKGLDYIVKKYQLKK